MIRLDQFSMVARTRMPEILKAQQMSQACGDAACAVELGKILAAQYVVFGSISKVGSTHVLLATLANVETAALERTARYEQTGSIDELLKTGVPSVARQLLDMDVRPTSPPLSASGSDQFSPKRIWPWLAGGAALVVGGVAVAAGGGSDGGGDSNAKVSGIWQGKTGTGGVSTLLNLAQNGNAINGRCTWWDRTVNCTGSVSGNRVTLYVESDRWELTANNNALNGIGYKSNGGTYQVQLAKR